ncbi:Bax inhibitor-1/YccA family protein [Enterobacter roggenkampii]
MVCGEYAGADDVYLLQQNHLLWADYRAAGAGVCAFGSGAQAECRHGNDPVYALFGANGLTLSSIFIVYTYSSIASTFVVTGGMFGAMSLYGYTTKRDLSGFGSMLFMGLIGIVLASLVNLWLKSDALMWAVTYIGVVLFVGLTAYDTQKLKNIGEQIDVRDSSNLRKYSILGALTLYLDFINLFLMLLRILGNRR